MKNITIIGATGTLGSSIVKELSNKDVQVKAVVRDIEKAKELLPANMELVYGDVSNNESLMEALQGTETLYLNLNTIDWDENAPFHPEREGIINVVDVSKKLGVKHIMQILGVDSSNPEFATQDMTYKTNLIRQPAIEHLKNSGINYTYFHCSVFLDSFPTFIQGEDFAILGNHTHPIYYTNTTDLTGLIYNAIDNPQTYNQSFTVQGTEGMSLPEAAEKFLRAYNDQIKVSVLPIETIQHIGLPSKEHEAFMEHTLTYMEQLKEEQVSEPTWELLGKPELTIEGFAKKISPQ